MQPFKFTEKQITVLKNFASINSSMIIQAERVEVINEAKTVIGRYKFEEALPIDFPVGIYETGEVIAILSAYKAPEITPSPKMLTISEPNGASKVKYFTTAHELLPKVVVQGKYTPDDVVARLEQVGYDLDFVLPAENLAMLTKMASLLKAEFIFFETVDGKVRVTVGDELDSSKNTWDVTLTEDIKISNLGAPMCASMAELRLIPSDYHIQMSTRGMSRWSSAIGVEYFIGCFAKEE